jgi:hypothetical protein
VVARRLPWAGRRAWTAAGVTAVLGSLLGLAMLRADANFAGAGRAAAATLIAPRVAAGQQVWYVGHWGFQWYAERAGARFFSLSPPYPMPGDLVVESRNSNPQIDTDLIREVLVPVGLLEDATPGGRLMDRKAGAGFFSNTWGYLPWAWSDEPIDSFFTWRVVKPDRARPPTPTPAR